MEIFLYNDVNMTLRPHVRVRVVGWWHGGRLVAQWLVWWQAGRPLWRGYQWRNDLIPQVLLELGS
jgi:hypothetical protein